MIIINHGIRKPEGFMFTLEKNLVNTSKDSPSWMHNDVFNYDALRVISLTNCLDFRHSHSGHPKYIQLVDNAIFINKEYAKHYNCLSDKNLYLGSPKYDIILEKKQVIQKYKFPDDKYCLIIAPKVRCFGIFLQIIVNVTKTLRLLGYKVVMKSRAKDSYSSLEKSVISSICDYYVEDISWFTHTTMDLLALSDLAINTDSTTIEECIMTRTPTINFKVKELVAGNHLTKLTPIPFLYENNVTVQQDLASFNQKTFIKDVERLTGQNLNMEFSNVIKKFLYEGNSSKAILDHYSIL